MGTGAIPAPGTIFGDNLQQPTQQQQEAGGGQDLLALLQGLPPELRGAFGALTAGEGQLSAGASAIQQLLGGVDAIYQMDPQIGGKRMSALLYEPLSWGQGDLLQMQKNLVGAGLIPEYAVERMVGGVYDEYTRKAYADLLSEAVIGKTTVTDVLQKRIAGVKGKSVTELFGDQTPENHLAKLQEAYLKVWGEQAPPGYAEQFVGQLNGTEFEAQERSKPGWENSTIAQSEMQSYSEQLFSFLSGPLHQGATSMPPLPQSSGLLPVNPSNFTQESGAEQARSAATSVPGRIRTRF